MSLRFIEGNLFDTERQTLVNTVNCVGAMGKGVALVTKLRYPALYEEYHRKCEVHEIKVGSLWLYKSKAPSPWVLNFPTKVHWKDPSRMEYLEKGLAFFIENYRSMGIASIAFPLLGAHNGGLDAARVRSVMTDYLSRVDIPVDIYSYDPKAPDALFERFKKKWVRLTPAELRRETGIRQDKQIALISDVLANGSVRSMLGLVELSGIGMKTLENCFGFTQATAPTQQSLFD